jgi:integrase
VILALLLGCALRRQELASLDVDAIQMREGRWVLPDLRGKVGRVRTVAISVWVKQGINAWRVAAKIEDGRLLRPLSKSGKLIGDELGDWAIWSVVQQSANEIGIEHFGAHDLRRTCAKLCRKNGGELEQIKFLLGHGSIQTTERYLGSGCRFSFTSRKRAWRRTFIPLPVENSFSFRGVWQRFATKWGPFGNNSLHKNALG